MRKQDDIATALRNAIRAGQYHVGDKIPSQIELAEQFCSTTITVNKAVNTLIDQGYLIRAKSTRAGTIVKSARPFPQGCIAFIACFGFGNLMLKGALQAAEQRNYMIVPFLREMGYDQTDCLQRLQNGNFCGLMTTSQKLFEIELPAVYMDTCHSPTPGLCQVRSNTYKGGQLLARALLDAGHREIVYCTFGEQFAATHLRRHGFFSELIAAGIPECEHRLFIGSEARSNTAVNLLREIFRHFPTLTALSCWNDYDAVILQRALDEMKSEVAHPIVITGFGNLAELQLFKPFATIEQFPEETGYRACNLLIDRLEYPNRTWPDLVELEVELVNANQIISNAIAPSSHEHTGWRK